jgi:hypothetical protein
MHSRPLDLDGDAGVRRLHADAILVDQGEEATTLAGQHRREDRLPATP